MSGIIEIWRRESNVALPVRFVVGAVPVLSDGTAAAEGPIVSEIVFRESGSFAGLRLNGGVFCISFEDSPVQRFIPERDLVEAAYETKQTAGKSYAPALPQE